MIKKISLPIQLLIIVGSVFAFGSFLNLEVIRFFYTFSLMFKEVLGFCLPFIIFSFIVSGILSLKKNALVVIPILFACIMVSNLIVILTSYFVSKNMLPFLTSGAQAEAAFFDQPLIPLFSFKLPTLINSLWAMLGALAIGIIFIFINVPKIENSLLKLKDVVEFILRKVFIPFLPLYVLGFLLKIKYEGAFYALFSHYGKAFVLIIIVQIVYLFSISATTNPSALTILVISLHSRS